MSTYRPQFARVPEDINVPLLQNTLVVVIGVGMVGSQIAEGVARFTVGRLRLIDHEPYEWENTLRHALPVEYEGWNKTIALEDWLPKQIEGLQVEAIPRKLDESITDQELDRWLAGADLIVAATDDRAAQRRIAQRALVSEVAAIFPAVYPRQGGGEVVLQLGPEWPCFGCWDYFRLDTEQLRGQRLLDHDAQPVIWQAQQLCLGYLDPGAKQDNLLRPRRAGEAPTQRIIVDDAGVPSFASLTWRDNCPCCRGHVPPPAAATRPRSVTQPFQPHPIFHVDQTPTHGLLLFVLIFAFFVALIVHVVADKARHSTQTTSEMAATPPSATPAPSTTETQASSTPTTPRELSAPPGTTVATALTIEPGVAETGYTGVVNYGTGACGQIEGQVWRVSLRQGETVKIVWDSPDDAVMDIDVLARGTTSSNNLELPSTVETFPATGARTETTFLAEHTAVYPLVFDDSCGQPGVFHFTLSVR